MPWDGSYSFDIVLIKLIWFFTKKRHLIMLVFNENDANNYNQCVCAQTPLRSINGRRIFPFNKGLRIYGGVYYPSFDTLKIGTSTDDIKLKLYR